MLKERRRISECAPPRHETRLYKNSYDDAKGNAGEIMNKLMEFNFFNQWQLFDTEPDYLYLSLSYNFARKIAGIDAYDAKFFDHRQKPFFSFFTPNPREVVDTLDRVAKNLLAESEKLKSEMLETQILPFAFFIHTGAFDGNYNLVIKNTAKACEQIDPVTRAYLIQNLVPNLDASVQYSTFANQISSRAVEYLTNDGRLPKDNSWLMMLTGRFRIPFNRPTAEMLRDKLP